VPPLLAAAFGGGVLLLLLVGPSYRKVSSRAAIGRARAAGLVIVLLAGSWPTRAAACGPEPSQPDELVHYHLDRQGSILAITSDIGALLRQIRFEAYGEIRGRFDGTGASVTPSERYRHEYTGWETDLGTSLEHAHARYYDPAVGQFTMHDPAMQFPSRYALGPGDPVNVADPTGAEGAAPAPSVSTGGSAPPDDPPESPLSDSTPAGDATQDTVLLHGNGIEDDALFQDSTLEDLAERTPEVMCIVEDQLPQGGLNRWDAVQLGLGAASTAMDASVFLAPFSWAPNAVDGVISVVRGDWAGAGMSVLAMVPVVGIAGDTGKAAHIVAKADAVRDVATKGTKNWSALFRSEREARALARQKLGSNPVDVGPNKWRSADGKWQYRAKSGDVANGHIHLEELP
jgi:RHS repeat-associated protein